MAASGPKKNRLQAMLSKGGELAGLYVPRFELTEDRYGPRIAAERIEDGQPVSLTFIACEAARGSVLIHRLEEYRGAPHKKVAELLDFGTCEGGVYCVQREVSPRTVASADRKTWDLRSIIPVVSQVLAPVADAHQRGHAVGAVFPSDISLARKQGRDLLVKVQNFGFEAALHSTGHTWLHAPEFDRSGATPAADVYAFGALCAALLSEDTLPTSNVAAWWSDGRVPAWRKAPSALVDAVGRMLDAEPSARPSDGTAVMELLIDAVPPALFKLPGTSTRSIPAIRLDALDPTEAGTGPTPIVSESTVPSSPVLDPVPASAAPSRRRPWLPVAAVAGLTASGAGLFLFGSSPEPAPPEPESVDASVEAPASAEPAAVAEPRPSHQRVEPEPEPEQPPVPQPSTASEARAGTKARQAERARSRKRKPKAVAPVDPPVESELAKPKPQTKPRPSQNSPLLGRSSDARSNRSSSALLPPSGSR
jgi:hypothetical protein